jgi:hypothetical protein
MFSESHFRPAGARLARRAAGVRGVTGAAVAAVAAGAVAGSLALSGVAQAAPVAGHRAASVTYTFTTLNDQADPTFNQLLGSNRTRLTGSKSQSLPRSG